MKSCRILQLVEIQKKLIYYYNYNYKYTNKQATLQLFQKQQANLQHKTRFNHIKMETRSTPKKMVTKKVYPNLEKNPEEDYVFIKTSFSDRLIWVANKYIMERGSQLYGTKRVLGYYTNDKEWNSTNRFNNVLRKEIPPHVEEWHSEMHDKFPINDIKTVYLNMREQDARDENCVSLRSAVSVPNTPTITR